MNVISHTDRLLLRQWKDSDRKPFAALNNDEQVMRFFPRRYTREESDEFINTNAKCIANVGWGAWAVETQEGGDFIGFVGFSRPAVWHPCAGKVDIGWRFRHEFWGFGYATEAAKLAMQIGFDIVNFDEIVSFTSECNLPSISVMKKIGMHEDPERFEHPRIDVENKLCRHVVYRLVKEDWKKGSA